MPNIQQNIQGKVKQVPQGTFGEKPAEQVETSSHLVIPTAVVMDRAAMPIKGIEELLGVKSARMADADALRDAIAKVDALCRGVESTAGTQKIHALMDLFGENAPEAIDSALSLKPWADNPQRTKDPDYQRTSEVKSIHRAYSAFGRGRMETATDGLTWREIMSNVRLSLKRLKEIKHVAKLKLEAESIAKASTGVAEDEDLPTEVAKQVSVEVKEKIEAETAIKEAKKAEKQTPKGIAKAVVARLLKNLGRDLEASPPRENDEAYDECVMYIVNYAALEKTVRDAAEKVAVDEAAAAATEAAAEEQGSLAAANEAAENADEGNSAEA